MSGPDVEAVVVDHACADIAEAVASVAALAPVTRVHVVDHAGVTPWPALQAAAAGAALVAHEHRGNPGFGAGANRALADVVAPYALLLNPDARVDVWDLDATIAAMSEVGAGVAGPNVVSRDGRPEASFGARQHLGDLVRRAAGRRSRVKLAEQLNPDEVRRVGWVSGVAMLLDVAAVRAVGGFDQRYFLYYEDMDLCRWLDRDGRPILRVGHGTVLHRGGGTQRSRLGRRIQIMRSLVRFLSTG